MEAFWKMTPRETWMALEAAAWRVERENERVEALIGLGYKMAGWLAWHTAALQRAKRMPSLKELIGGGGTKRLTAEEAAGRKREFEELKRVAEKSKNPHPSPLPPREREKARLM